MLEELVGNDEHSDVTLLVRDGEVVPAHRLLLATRCPALCSVTGVCLNTVYTIQPVWQPAVSCKRTSNRLTTSRMFVYTIQLVVNAVWQTQFDNRVEQTAVRSTSCQTRLYRRIDNRLYTRYSRLSDPFDNRLTMGLTTGWMFVYMIQPLSNGFDNGLYHVDGALYRVATLRVKRGATMF